MALALLVVPLTLSAQVEPVAGSVTVGVHIDFVGRYSVEDNRDGVGGPTDPDSKAYEPDAINWPGYETLNMEAAVVYLSGKVGDKVSWVIGEALTMPAHPVGEVVATGGVATLLDARIIWNLTDSIALNLGRYIPATSMSVSPHRMSVHHLVDPPMMIKGTGYALSLVPLPWFQTGAGISIGMGPATISWDLFDGSQVAGSPNSLSDVDKCKGGVIKVAVDSGNIHAGFWYLNERSDMSDLDLDPVPIAKIQSGDSVFIADMNLNDNDVTQWGLEVAYTTDKIILAAEYLDTVLDPMDESISIMSGSTAVATTEADDLKQQSYYILAGVGLGPVDLILRYEFAEAGIDDMLDLDEDEISDQQTNTTIGVNYGINDYTTLAINYAMKAPEGYKADIDGDGDLDDIDLPNIDEWSMMVELDLL